MKGTSFGDVDIIKTVDSIFADALARGASDIHIEPQNDKMIIRYRIDGILKVVVTENMDLFELMLARIKIMADLETTGLPRSQEGNIKFEHVDMRVSILPTSFGENVVIRILEAARKVESFEELGFTSKQILSLESIIQKPFGLILVTGTTGSGKSTTLFTMLNKLNTPERKLATLEDPVERKIDMVRQTQINLEVGLTFAEGLRCLLRQDPDIIMVGEIRDNETARIAVDAAVTGHLVLASIHTNNAAGAIIRLLNMGVEPFLLSSAIRFISCQRLARLNCHNCLEQITPTPEMLNALNAPKDMKFFHSKGCDECDSKGFKGRAGIHEILVPTQAIKNLILSRPTDDQIITQAEKEGMENLRQVALSKVNEGLITVEEALRITE